MRGFYVFWEIIENNLFLNFTMMTIKPTTFGQIFKSEIFVILKNFDTSKSAALPVQIMQDLVYLGFRAF